MSVWHVIDDSVNTVCKS